MRFAVFEDSSLQFGGRQKTMCGFVRILRDAGNEVILFFMEGGTVPQWEWIPTGAAVIPGDGNNDHLKKEFTSHGPFDHVIVPFPGIASAVRKFYLGHILIWLIAPDRIASNNPFMLESLKDFNTDFLTNSQTIAQMAIKKWPGIKNRISVFYAPHDYSVFRDHSRAWQKREYDFCYVGRLPEVDQNCDKNFQWFRDAAEKYTSARFIAICSNNDTARAGNLPSNLELIGKSTAEQIAIIMGNSKYFLYPSLIESCPLVVYEAMNAGCIPICYDVGAVLEQIGDAGLVFRSREEMFYILDIITGEANKKALSRGRSFDVSGRESVFLSRFAQKMVSAEDYTDKLATLVLVKDRADIFRECFTSIRKNIQGNVHILNNGSENHELISYIESIQGGRTFIHASSKNLFCAPGRAHLLSQINIEKYEFLFFIDDDIILYEDPENVLPEFKNPDIGAITGLLLCNGSVDCASSNYSLDGDVWKRKITDSGNVPKNIRPTFCNFAIGGLTIIRSEIAQNICHGLKHYTAGKADYDWSFRLARLGKKILFHPGLVGIHKKDYQADLSKRIRTGQEEEQWRTPENLLESAMRFRALWGHYERNDFGGYSVKYEKYLQDHFGISWSDVRGLGI